MQTLDGSVVVVVLVGGDFDFDVEAPLSDEDANALAALSTRPTVSSATPDLRMTFSRFRVRPILGTTALTARTPKSDAFATLQ
jgi:hypothetical protein